jgi:hypothetical protein
MLHFFLVSKMVPLTQIPKLMRALSRFPVISITALSVEAGISRHTAKRWLHGLEQGRKLQVREFNGMSQYAYSPIIEILDRHIREAAQLEITELHRRGDHQHHQDRERCSPSR